MNLLPLNEQEEDHLYLFDDNPDSKNAIRKELQLMLFYIRRKELKENFRFNQKIDRLIKKLETAKSKGTRKQLEELEQIYMQTHKYTHLSTLCDDDIFFTRLPLYGGTEDIDKNISFLKRCKKDRLLKEKDYIFKTKDDAIYFTLLDNLKSKFRVQYKTRDVILITFSRIYEILKKSCLEKPLESTKNLLENFVNDFVIDKQEIFPVYFHDIQFNVYRISYKDFYYEISQVYLDDYGKPYYEFEVEPDIVLNKYYSRSEKRWIKKYLFFGNYEGGIKRYKALNINSDKYLR